MKHTLVVFLALMLAGCNVTAFNVFAYDPYAAMQKAEQPTRTATVTATARLTDQLVSSTPTPQSVTVTQCTVTAAEALHLRSGPGTGYSVIGYLSPGDLLTVTDERGAWMAVTTPGDLKGWVHSEYCE